MNTIKTVEIPNTPIYFKSKKGISGLDKDTAFFVKDIPTYGNIKVHYYKGLLEMFIFFTKDEFMKQFNSEDFYKIQKEIKEKLFS